MYSWIQKSDYMEKKEKKTKSNIYLDTTDKHLLIINEAWARTNCCVFVELGYPRYRNKPLCKKSKTTRWLMWTQSYFKDLPKENRAKWEKRPSRSVLWDDTNLRLFVKTSHANHKQPAVFPSVPAFSSSWFNLTWHWSSSTCYEPLATEGTIFQKLRMAHTNGLFSFERHPNEFRAYQFRREWFSFYKKKKTRSHNKYTSTFEKNGIDRWDSFWREESWSQMRVPGCKISGTKKCKKKDEVSLIHPPHRDKRRER